MKLALCGNPNVGKTTLFNRLTRSSAPVGNWHGVTVEAKQKRVTGHKDVTLVDLPGAYSLTARSDEERVTRDGVLFGDFDAVIVVAEVNNLRRNLYLLTQLAEAGKKLVLVVNMMDESRHSVDLELLSERLGIPVVGASEKRKNPTEEIISSAKRAACVRIDYASSIGKDDAFYKKAAAAGLCPTFAAMKLVERDEFVESKLGGTNISGAACRCCGSCRECDRDMPARLRYDYIDRMLSGVIGGRTAGGEKKARFTEKLDRIVLGRFALPVFFAVMAVVFVITFEAGKPLSDLMARLPQMLSDAIGGAIPVDWVRALVCDGLIAGVGAVLAFLPQTVILFLLTALLQDSGYMSRVAFVTDDFFKKFGLGGRAAFSVILGLGCSATAVMSTRGISERSTRIRTAFIAPYVPCSARLAVFTAITAYFGLPSVVVAAMYVLGCVAALVVLKASAPFVKNSRAEELLMEIPPYRIPSFKRMAKSVGRDIGSFIARVGSVVLCVNVIIWVLSSFSVVYGFNGGAESSIMFTISDALAPVFAPLGFGDWRAVTALISGVAAKETVIAVIASLGGLGEVFGSTTAAVSFTIFTCLYVPCIATLAAVGKECGTKIAALSALVHFVVAYFMSFVFYFTAMSVQTNILHAVILWGCIVASGVVFGAVVHIKRKKQKSKQRIEHGC